MTDDDAASTTDKVFEIRLEYGHYEHYLFFALRLDFAARRVHVRTEHTGTPARGPARSAATDGS